MYIELKPSYIPYNIIFFRHWCTLIFDH